LSRPEISCHIEDLFMNQTTPRSKKRNQRDYTLGFKLSVVDQIEKGEITYKQAQQTFGIQGSSTVLIWLRKHGKLDWSNPGNQLMNQMNETPAQKIKRLEKELEDERLRNTILHDMMDIVDKTYGASLRKKYLSKVSQDLKPEKK